MSYKSIVFAVAASVFVVSVTGYLYLETDLVDESDVDAEARENPTDGTESECVDHTGPLIGSDEASDEADADSPVRRDSENNSCPLRADSIRENHDALPSVGFPIRCARRCE